MAKNIKELSKHASELEFSTIGSRLMWKMRVADRIK